MKPQQNAKPGARVEPPIAALPGDEVYFYKAAGVPASGKLVCHGEHGCTIEHEGMHHKAHWHNVLGVKRRAKRRYHVEEERDDGMIVRDHTGRRSYVAIPSEARQPSPAKKRP